MTSVQNRLRGSVWNQPLLSVVQNHLVTYPTPSNLTGNWNWGVLAGLCLVLQIVTGIFLAMHYAAHVDLAFPSVQHLMRDVPNGWLLRYLHANGASLFFIVVYMHLFRGLYYTSYAQPRELVWLIGVVILLIMILTAFIGYVLPWGKAILAPYGRRTPLYALIFSPPALLSKIGQEKNHHANFRVFHTSHLPANRRIGPHRLEVLAFFTGSLLGDGFAERHGKGVRLTIHVSKRNITYLTFLQHYLLNFGYVSSRKPKISKSIGSKGHIYYSIKLRTWSFGRLEFLRKDWYPKGVKVLPSNLELLITPLRLAVWAIDDSHFTGSGILLYTDSFTKEEIQRLGQILEDKFGLAWHLRLHRRKYWRIYIPAKAVPLFRTLTAPYFCESIKYKLGLLPHTKV